MASLACLRNIQRTQLDNRFFFRYREYFGSFRSYSVRAVSYDAGVVRGKCRSDRRGMPAASAGGNLLNLGDAATLKTLRTRSDPALCVLRFRKTSPT